MVVVILETVEKAKRNRDDLKELCENIVEIIKIIQDQPVAHGDTGALKFKGLCEDLASVLEGVLQSIKQLPTESQGFSGRFKEVMKLGSTADKIAGYRMRIQELRSNFMVYIFYFHKDSSAAPVTQTITKCPPPSRIFHGRQNILDKMHKFFEQDLGKQHIYLLHGLGGAGKTQIALKFIEELSARFSDIFLIDTSTTETIDTGLKDIAATRNAGSTARDGLDWLSSKPAEWLLFFDNADDPKIDLNTFFPGCKHGNILITSRNPSLRVYAGGHSLVSDMEEPDAVDLLLTSAAQAITPGNKEIAAEIVKTLYHLPLAIIQAGAFISESGALDGYLALYAENRDQLLSEKPAQSHDDYAWTVYTTWNISFQKLSKIAATILQLCSFLHHKGIFEEIFSRAAVYDFTLQGPSEEEVQKPLEFLSQFLGPMSTWDPLRFLKAMNEIKAYSLVNFDPEGKLYSIHPLVHNWTRRRPKDAEQLYLAVLEHRRSVLGEDHLDTLHAMGALAVTYTKLGNLQEAEALEIVVLEKRRKILGEDHPDTLLTMANLTLTYHKLGKLQEAEELEVVVLGKRKKILGEDHLETLHTMANLASTYTELGKLQEAEELEVVVLEKRRQILGEDHPDILRAMGNLASTCNQIGKLQDAEELGVVVLEKRRKVLGEDHPDTLHAMGNLASTYHRLGKLQEAEELGVVVVEKRKKILGEDHLWTLNAIGWLAATCYNLNKFKEAEQLYVELLDRRTALCGAHHPDTLCAANDLSITRQAIDDNSLDHS
ncbi:P-loop containing nucleoside triphosphate hydrolase protein [Mycena vulgaris]|nr:P-loop containing nucleoside triphosphate hydrolase protein [Mycena vulgaris]